MHPSTALLALAALIVTEPARAQNDDPARTVAVTISPFHLLNPQLHVTGEVRLARRASVAAILGAGTITDEDETYRIWDVGGQFRYYILGSFARGAMVGADLGYVDVDGEPANAMEYFVGTRAGGFIGDKWTAKRGFTVEAQFGPIYVWGIGDRAEAQTLTNLKVGWSF